MLIKFENCIITHILWTIIGTTKINDSEYEYRKNHNIRVH